MMPKLITRAPAPRSDSIMRCSRSARPVGSDFSASGEAGMFDMRAQAPLGGYREDRTRGFPLAGPRASPSVRRSVNSSAMARGDSGPSDRYQCPIQFSDPAMAKAASLASHGLIEPSETPSAM